MDNNRSNLVKMGKHICDLRKQNGLTQKKLGELLDVSDKTISKWEQGSIAPDITILKSLANVLGIGLDELLSGEKKEEINFRDNSDELSTNSNLTRKRIVSDIFIIVFSFLIVILFILNLGEKNKWSMKEINVNCEFSFKGYYSNNGKKTIIFINKIIPVKEIKHDYESLEIKVYSKDSVI